MCTGIRLIAQDGAVVYARTMEFAQNMESNVLVIPRNYTIKSLEQEEKKGWEWASKYAVVGANAMGVIGIVDGVNEVGLAGGLFYFSGYAGYQPINDDAKSSIAPWELMTWILTNFKSVGEVKRMLPLIKVVDVVFGPWGITPPVHAIVHDASGQSLVIEYVQGELHMHDNPLGVITNAPTFDWHITNLKNYISLSAENITQIKINDIALTPLSQGSGMLGLPGDFTSPSRFVRAVAFSQSVLPSKGADSARESIFHVLNLFDIPLGVVREKERDSTTHYNYTQWTSASDLQNARYYWHTHNNRQVHMVDLKKMDLNAKTHMVILMQHADEITDMSLHTGSFIAAILCLSYVWWRVIAKRKSLL